MVFHMTSPMSATVTIIPCRQCSFRTSRLRAPTCSCSSGGATSFISSTFPRQTSRHGAVSTACVRASGESAHTLLGVAHGASKGEIKKAYRRLALQFHPDVCRGDHCSAQFQLITSAYEALTAIIDSRAPSHSSFDDASEHRFVDPNDGFLDELEEWMGLEGAGTYDFSTPIDDFS